MQQLVQHDAERPEIASMIDIARRAHLFGRHVRGRSHHRLGGGEVAIGGRCLRDSEVEHLQQRPAVGPSRDEEVRRLDVSVHDPKRVRFGQGLAGLQHEVDNDADEQLRSGDVREIGALQVFEHHVRRTRLEGADVDDARDVFALESNGRLRLPQEALHDLLISEHLRQQKLHRHGLMKLEVHGLHDDAHTALAEHPLDAVSARENSADRNAPVLRHGIPRILTLQASNGPLIAYFPSPTRAEAVTNCKAAVQSK